DKETTRSFKSTFEYSNSKGVKEKIILPEIKVHFVQDQEEQKQQQEQNQQKEQQSQTEEEKQAEQKQSQSQPQYQPQTSEDKMQKQIQNNQQSQDSSALKNQIQKELQEETNRQQELANNIAQNKDFQKAAQELMDKGFEPREYDLGEDTFTQEFYNNKTGEKAQIKADVNNNTISSVMKNFEDKSLEEKILSKNSSLNEKLRNKIDSLMENGFNESPMMFSENANGTTFQKELIGPNNETVKISGSLEEEIITDLEIIEDANTFEIISLILVLVLLLFFGLKYLRLNKKEQAVLKEVKKEVTIDYAKEALQMIKRAKDIHADNKKDAYELLSYSVRYYYTNVKRLKKEISGSKFKLKVKDKNMHQLIDLAGLVEFAKGKSEKKQFDSSVVIATDFIKNAHLEQNRF
ncbi:hypothetical protein BVX95_01240, partial [archaeon D22]